MRIGDLRHVIEIQNYTDTPSSSSSVTPTYTTVATVWASVEPLKGLTVFDTKSIGEGVSHKMTIRYGDIPVTSESWVLFDNRRFRVRSVRDIMERKRWTELLCEEEGAAS